MPRSRAGSGAADPDRLAVEQDLARSRRRDAEDGERELGAARADEPGDPQNLAAVCSSKEISRTAER